MVVVMAVMVVVGVVVIVLGVDVAGEKLHGLNVGLKLELDSLVNPLL